jgi:hypothetical protein
MTVTEHGEQKREKTVPGTDLRILVPDRCLAPEKRRRGRLMVVMRNELLSSGNLRAHCARCGAATQVVLVPMSTQHFGLKELWGTYCHACEPDGRARYVDVAARLVTFLNGSERAN